ncbi:hypothetical protein [Hydrogenophaga sp.]|uniref:hypothetical protein n=1 Tax=Hydrogenophaga sp. TaxID=1904254 RepID=UPI003F6D8604
MQNQLSQQPAPSSTWRAGSARAAQAKEAPTVTYLQASMLLAQRPRHSLRKTQLEKLVAPKLKGASLAVFDTERGFNPVGQQREMRSAMIKLKLNARRLKQAGLDVLVVDTLGALSPDCTAAFTAALEHVWKSGIEVIILDLQQQPISFNDLGQVVSNSQFIKIYIRSIWEEIQRTGSGDQKPPVAAQRKVH